MSGQPLKFAINSDAIPHAIYTPPTVPVLWQEEVKKKLARNVELGILEEVPANEPTVWQHRMVVAEQVTKNNRGHASPYIAHTSVSSWTGSPTGSTGEMRSSVPGQHAYQVVPGHWRAGHNHQRWQPGVQIRAAEDPAMVVWGPQQTHLHGVRVCEHQGRTGSAVRQKDAEGEHQPIRRAGQCQDDPSSLAIPEYSGTGHRPLTGLHDSACET